MATKQAMYKILGMQRDNSVSAFNPQFAYENRNMRILAREDNTSLSMVNEKGNKQIILYDQDLEETFLKGIPLGYSVLNNYLVIFTSDSSLDYIYRLCYVEDKLVVKILYTGNLNFNTLNPIETLSFYENEDIQKVYWVDGRNQPRVINIVSSDTIINSWIDDSFNFVQELSLAEKIEVNKDTVSAGSFTSGIIQYSFSYYNLYRQESNIFYSSPLLYVSYNNRGGSAEEQIGNKFTINIKNVDTNFDYIRIYSTHRSSYDGTPTTRKVVDLSINKNDPKQEIIFTDNGTQGEVIDNTLLLYIGGEDIIPATMAQKDNTLFLGNLKLNRPLLGNIDIQGTKLVDYFKDYPKKKFDFFTRGRNDRNSDIFTDQATEGVYPYDIGLHMNSSDIKHFKYLETYRLGIQAQYKTGKWSEPIWLNDIKITNKPSNSNNKQINALTVPALTLKDPILFQALLNNGYRKIRPVMVQSSISDRDCIAQGVLCPTIYNVRDRMENAPFSQSSWFFRPNPPYEVSDLDSDNNIMDNNKNVFKGAWAEFRHNKPIPHNLNRNCEISILCDRNLSEPSTKDYNDSEFVSRYGENYFIDSSIVSFHSPEIEFNDSIQNSIDTSELKLRIVGKVYITGTAQDVDLTTSSATFSSNKPGFCKPVLGTKTYDSFGFKSLISGPLFWDATRQGGDDGEVDSFVVYPWQANRPLNDDFKEGDRTQEQLTSMLDKKKMSNLKYAAHTDYLDIKDIWYAEESGNNNKNGITPITVFNSNEIITTRIQRPLGSKLSELNYYGNIDKVITLSLSGEKKDGQYLVISGETKDDNYSFDYFYSLNYRLLDPSIHAVNKHKYIDPVRMKYNSSPHAVFSFNYNPKNNNQIILPSINNLNRIDNLTRTPFWDGGSTNIYQDNINTPNSFTWVDKANPFGTDINGNPMYVGKTAKYGTMWLGELYREIPEEERFGGKSTEAFENNIWIPSGTPQSITKNSDNVNIADLVDLVWQEGDTYSQRYDCLKTYPTTLEDQNSVVEILSFICETHINLDGRYDRNRGNTSNLVAMPTNFNLFNSVYSQSNNFYNYRSLNYIKSSLDYFPNSLTWTKEKVIGEEIDTWTNITVASTLDLDGDKGEITSLNNYNNDIVSFQKKGIASILFNSRVQIPTVGNNSAPIEIANSGKVDGKRYISNKIGSDNKWSIIDTNSGIVFIDTLSKAIYKLADNGLINISDTLGFHSWSMTNFKDDRSWNPKYFDNFTSFYDSENKDIYFVNKEEALNYSELSNQFISFFDYGNTPFMFNYKNMFISLKSKNNLVSLWEQGAGEYNQFFGEFKPYYSTIVVNPDVIYDKTFTNLEFRSDRWDENNILLSTKTFDTLSVWNEYQKGVGNLSNISISPLSLRKKFRVWRAGIPRDSANPLQRMRNTWMYLKLENKKENYNKNILHDMVVSYIV